MRIDACVSCLALLSYLDLNCNFRVQSSFYMLPAVVIYALSLAGDGLDWYASIYAHWLQGERLGWHQPRAVNPTASCAYMCIIVHLLLGTWILILALNNSCYQRKIYQCKEVHVKQSPMSTQPRFTVERIIDFDTHVRRGLTSLLCYEISREQLVVFMCAGSC